MDEILAKAGSQAVTFAIKSGISIASTYAIKTIAGFVTQIPKADARRIDLLKTKLEDRIEIVSSAIDLIKLVAARGNTNLESTLRLTGDLKNELDSFDESIKDLTAKVEGSKSAKSQKEAIDSVETYIKDLLLRIEEVTPFINLSLTTSGANLSSSLPQQISPGLLLRASEYINESNKRGESQVGPSFEITLFSVFYNLNKEQNSKIRVTWKEDMKRAFVKVMRVEKKSHLYSYQLKIEQTFDDGRYHDEEDEKEKPQTITVNLNQIVKLFFSVSGNLLKLPEQESPVLVLKVDKNIAGTDSRANPSIEDIWWYAFGQYEEVSDTDSDSEESTGESDKAVEEQPESSTSITLLEYIIRLASLQESDQSSILEVSDERLSIYLNDENPNSIREKTSDIENVTQKLENVTIY